MQLPGLKLEGLGMDLAWRETQTEGVFWIPLHLDAWEADAGAKSPDERTRGGGTVLIRMDPGCGYPPHRHLGAEDVLVLQGGYSDEYGAHVTGSHVHYPAGSSHGPVALGTLGAGLGAENPPCVLFATAALGVELLGAPEEAGEVPPGPA